MASFKQEIRLRLSWRGRLAMVGLETATLVARCRMERLAEAIAKPCIVTLMTPDVWVVCRS